MRDTRDNQIATDALLARAKKIHMVGIGGSGMFPLAQMLLARGAQLTGSDNNETDTLARVRAMGVPVHLGHARGLLGDADALVYSSAISAENPERQEAAELGIPQVERMMLLGWLSRQYRQCIGVAGTHGKTTATALLTQILLESGLDPSAIIGGRLPAIDGSGRSGASAFFVCEADEFKDTFLQISPDTAVLLCVDDDHLEYFGTVERLTRSFHDFLSMAKSSAIINGSDPRCVEAAKGIAAPVTTFGWEDSCDYYPANVELSHGMRAKFDLMRRGEKLCALSLSIPGRHNVLNAVAAAVAALLSGATPELLAQAVPRFGGAGRRFEILGEPGGVVIADDYAHHPAELRATLTAAKGMGYRAVWAVFQPFTFSRTERLMDDFAQVLPIADHVVLSPIMGSREVNITGVKSEDLAAKIPGCVVLPDFDAIAGYIAERARPGDLVITLGCGDIYKAAKKMVERQA